MLVVSAPSDTVNHYGFAYIADVQSIYSDSYHEYGTVGRLKVAQGHAVVESTGTVFCAMDKDGEATGASIDVVGKVYSETSTGAGNVNANVTQQDSGVFNSEYKDCGYGHHNMQKLVVDSAHVYEVCTACGYTVMVAGTDEGTSAPIYHTSSNQEATVSDPVVTVNPTTKEVTVTETESTKPIVYGDVQEGTNVEEIATCEHVFGDMAVVTEATTEATGIGKYTCTKCGFAYTVTIPLKPEQSYPYAIIENVGWHTLGNTAATNILPSTMASLGSDQTKVYGATLADGTGSEMGSGKDTTLENVWKYSAVLNSYTEQQIKDYFGDYKTFAFVISFDKDVAYDNGNGNLVFCYGSLGGGQWIVEAPVKANYDKTSDETSMNIRLYAEYCNTKTPGTYSDEFVEKAIEEYKKYENGDIDDLSDEYLEFLANVIEGEDADFKKYAELASFTYSANTEYTFDKALLSLDNVLAGTTFQCSAAMLDLDGSNDNITMTVKLYAYKSEADAKAISSDRKLANEISYTFGAAE